ncbi:MAG: hypothetical protein KC609_17055 [Myxococcales bacterium]|nr:hypothetical protein [Myxococcales bacterium]
MTQALAVSLFLFAIAGVAGCGGTTRSGDVAQTADVATNETVGDDTAASLDARVADQQDPDLEPSDVAPDLEPSDVAPPDAATTNDTDASDVAPPDAATSDDADAALEPDLGPAPPGNCSAPGEIVLDNDGRFSVTRSFLLASSDYEPSSRCSSPTGAPDAVYRLNVPEGTHDVEIDTVGSTANTILALGFDCTPAGLSQVCNDDADQPGGPSRIWLHRVTGPLELYILVDSHAPDESGSFTLNVQLNNPGADGCPTISAAPLDISAGGTVVGSLVAGGQLQNGSCQPVKNAWPEAVFRLTSPADGTMSFEVLSNQFTPAIYLRQSSCSAGTELGCSLGASDGQIWSSTLELTSSGSTTHYLFVDGGTGSYVLTYRPH